ncbi:hypothetical protein DCAR_0310178 [Daucus carota subsp. sativus]|uniref:Uncharacterized protein n=1 Tax=Daucus carota subsp. sativus TaxID=79200 RepID=A0AAF1ASN6_DAUCS|nr:hypothetical protein DCAR_0310178 [Daucus carota subsp. sativus]
MIRVGKMVEFLEDYRVFMSILRHELSLSRPAPRAAPASDSTVSQFFVYF